MPHPEFWPFIDAYADGQLPPEQLPRLDRHLQDCEDCRMQLANARREVVALRTALIAARPPVDLAAAVMTRIGATTPSVQRATGSGVLAGIIANLVTALALVGLSVGAGASLAVMSTVAVIGALAWGAVKGGAFALSRSFLPGGVVVRGLVFGIATWVLCNVVVAAISVSGGLQFATTVILVGSLVHFVVYGVLLSWLFEQFQSRRSGSTGPPLRLRNTPLPAAVFLLALFLAVIPGIQVSRAPVGTPVIDGTTIVASESATVDLTVAPTDTATLPVTTVVQATASPTNPSPAPSSTVSATPQVSTTATPPPTPSPMPTATARPTPTSTPLAVSRVPEASRPPREQVRDILPSVVFSGPRVTTYQRVRDVAVLLDFL